jgi:hypothetical protein
MQSPIFDEIILAEDCGGFASAKWLCVELSPAFAQHLCHSRPSDGAGAPSRGEGNPGLYTALICTTWIPFPRTACDTGDARRE